MLSDDTVLELFYRQAASADISLIEGVMGLFDGAGGLDERGSTSHLSKLLRSPVVLMMDVGSMARSAAAVALGFKEFDPDVEISGFILNRVASPRHEEMVRSAVENRTGLPVLGAIPRSSNLTMPERHLGLVPAWEGDEIIQFLDENTGLLEQSIDLDALISAANTAPEIGEPESRVFKTPSVTSGKTERDDNSTQPVRIAYAWDKAFHFYYEDNLDLLRHKGVELVHFSPIADMELPENINGIYIGGGYPELFTEELSSNTSMLRYLCDASESGMPVWAECGGLMYLSESIRGFDGSTAAMAGIIPGKTVMKKGLRALGYYTGELRNDSWMGKAGEKLTGHVFHWSEMTELGPETAYQLTLKKDSGTSIKLEDGIYINRTWAGYMHIHFASDPRIVNNFINACRDYSAEKTRK